MKIAVVYNSPDAAVLQHRGPRCQEIYPPRNIDRVVEALDANGHQGVAVEADRYLVERLEALFSPMAEGRIPGLVFNLAFGVQGELRYCHVPGLLDMLGLPYLGSGPWGHALASDKGTAKAIFLHHGLPTPEFVIAQSGDFNDPGLGYPVVVKPVAGASSLGLHWVHNERELREAVREDLALFGEPALVERYIEGREINVGVLGNDPPRPLPPVEVEIGEGGPPIYTAADKHGTATREFRLHCPALLPEALSRRAQALAVSAFRVLNCRDWARVEMRLDARGELQLLEVNTIPGLGPNSSLPAAAQHVGLADLPALVQRLVDIALARYRRQAAE
jgi:D-alanine-D-alanine ligase